jgi:hypothetical protein
MAVMTYNDFGTYIGLQSPYARPNNPPPPPNPGDNVATLPPNFTVPSPGGTTIRDRVNYVWDFRHAFPWDHEPSDTRRALKVQNYQIIKAILIPYSYNRHLESRNGGFTITGGVATPTPQSTTVALEVTAHLLIGYTIQTPAVARDFPVAPPIAPANPYEELGTFIRDQTPFALNWMLDADELNRTTLEIGVSWLAHLSAFSAGQGGPRLKSTSDNEMDLIQEQQCFNWDFEADPPTGGAPPFGQVFGSGAMPPPINPQYPPPPPPGLPWMRNWQVSKAIRALYHAIVPVDPNNPGSGTQVVRGEILVGFTGGGGM